MIRRVLITGGNGKIGKNIVGMLIKTYDITLLLRTKPQKSKIKHNIRVIYGDIESPSEWKGKVTGIDCILHIAGVTHSTNKELYNRINTEGTKNLIESAKTCGVKQFVYVSTRAIGKNSGPYGLSKKKAEDIIKKSGVNYTILRVAEAYDNKLGSEEGLGSLSRIVNKSYIVPYLFPGVFLSPVHMTDVSRSILNSINNKLAINKTYTIAGPENLSMHEVVRRLAQYRKLNRLLVPIPTVLIKPIFYILSKLNIVYPDQLDRLLSKKDSLSYLVASELGVFPRKFLV